MRDMATRIEGEEDHPCTIEIRMRISRMMKKTLVRSSEEEVVHPEEASGDAVAKEVDIIIKRILETRK
mgnify:CR=1 FL=1